MESGHEDRRLFVGVKAGYDAAKERCKEEIELLKFLLPANSGNIEKDLIFLALHRGYKQQKAARALSRETIALVKEAADQKRGKAYEEKVWRDLCNAKEFNEWPLRPYGDSLNTLAGNMARVADYIKILKAEMDAYPQIKETSFGQKIKNMLSKGGDWLEDITKGISAIITEWRGIKKEEDKKIEQRAKQPAGNSFPPTPFDLHRYTNSARAKLNGIEENTPSEIQQENLSKVHECIDALTGFLGYRPSINSGFRNPKVNSIVGGEDDSLHLEGQAADLGIPKSDYDRVMQWLKNTNNVPEITTAIAYPNANIGYIHISVAASGVTNGGKKRSLLKKYKGDPIYYQYFKD